MKMLVLYHRDLDGYASLYAVWKRFGNDPKVTTFDHISVQYGEPIPEDAKDYDEVYIVDFAFPRAAMIELSKHVKLTVIDHHEGSFDQVVNAPFAAFHDTRYAGCMLTWMLLFPKTPAPFVIKYAEDYDLHVFKLPSSREINSYLHTLTAGDFEAWDSVDEETALSLGSTLYNATMHSAKFLYKRAVVATRVYGGREFTVHAMNAPIHYNEAATLAYTENPDTPFAMIYRNDGKQWLFGLRLPQGYPGANLNQVARVLGGGGHPAAAGFVLTGSIDPKIIAEITMDAWNYLRNGFTIEEARFHVMAALHLVQPGANVVFKN